MFSNAENSELFYGFALNFLVLDLEDLLMILSFLSLISLV
jgi:hypothetical protein